MSMGAQSRMPRTRFGSQVRVTSFLMRLINVQRELGVPPQASGIKPNPYLPQIFCLYRLNI